MAPVLTIERSLGIRCKYGISRQRVADLKGLYEGFTEINEKYGHLHSREIRSSLELEFKAQDLFEEHGPSLWPPPEKRHQATWLFQANEPDNDLELYPRDLFYDNPQDRKILQPLFLELCIAKCQTFYRNGLNRIKAQQRRLQRASSNEETDTGFEDIDMDDQQDGPHDQEFDEVDGWPSARYDSAHSSTSHDQNADSDNGGSATPSESAIAYSHARCVPCGLSDRSNRRECTNPACRRHDPANDSEFQVQSLNTSLTGLPMSDSLSLHPRKRGITTPHDSSTRSKRLCTTPLPRTLIVLLKLSPTVLQYFPSESSTMLEASVNALQLEAEHSNGGTIRRPRGLLHELDTHDVRSDHDSHSSSAHPESSAMALRRSRLPRTSETSQVDNNVDASQRVVAHSSIDQSRVDQDARARAFTPSITRFKREQSQDSEVEITSVIPVRQSQDYSLGSRPSLSNHSVDPVRSSSANVAQVQTEGAYTHAGVGTGGPTSMEPRRDNPMHDTVSDNDLTRITFEVYFGDVKRRRIMELGRLDSVEDFFHQLDKRRVREWLDCDPVRYAKKAELSTISSSGDAGIDADFGQDIEPDDGPKAIRSMREGLIELVHEFPGVELRIKVTVL